MTISKDVVGKAVKDFIAEAEEIVDHLSVDLISLGDCSDSGDCNPEIVNSIFRGAHSLKGLAGMFGFSDIADLAHNLENLLDSLRLGKVPLTPTTISVLFEAAEQLTGLVRAAGSGGSGAADSAALIAKINSCLVATEAKNLSPLEQLGLPTAVINTLTEYEEHRLLENVKKGRRIYLIHASFSLATFDHGLADLTDGLKKVGEVISTLPSAGGSLGASIDFDIIFGSDKTSSEVGTIVDRDNVSLKLIGDSALKSMSAASMASPPVPVQPGSVPIETATSEEQSMTAKSISRTVRVDIGKLDELMNIVGELVLSHSTISGIVNRMRAAGLPTFPMELNKAANVLQRKLNELQKGVMDIRMIPVAQLFEKMSRIVRKFSREQGKKIELKMFGADTVLDKLIVEDISDPVMHIIRNSIDHGIETSEDRIKAGKSEKGMIKLSSYQKGNYVVIEIEDDGRGIDLEKVKKKAFEKGLIRNIENTSDREALELIFLPGFSTSDTVSELSGRGVGMDVVKNNLAAISGMVDIVSEKGKGTKVIITLPITLAIIKALIIEVAGRTYAIPITSVLETLVLENKDILSVERKEVIQLRESTLPLLHLDRFFGIKRQTPVKDDNVFVVVVGVAEKRLGMRVDTLHGQQDIVIKSLGETFKGFKGISGAADLGDQRTILVLDIGGIITEATRGMGDHV